MKVSSVHPIIISDNAKETVEFYAGLGFEITHDSHTIMGNPVYVIRNGEAELEIMETPTNAPNPMPAGLYGIRINVDDLDAAVEAFKQKGGTILAGPLENEWSKVYVGQDAEGINITLMKHIRR